LTGEIVAGGTFTSSAPSKDRFDVEVSRVEGSITDWDEWGNLYRIDKVYYTSIEITGVEPSANKTVVHGKVYLYWVDKKVILDDNLIGTEYEQGDKHFSDSHEPFIRSVEKIEGCN
jgi:hypothetical protein